MIKINQFRIDKINLNVCLHLIFIETNFSPATLKDFNSIQTRFSLDFGSSN